MSKGLQSTLKLYDDYFRYSPEETIQIINKINENGYMDFIIEQNNKMWEKVLTDGINKKTTGRT